MTMPWQSILDLGIFTHSLTSISESKDEDEILEITKLIASEPFFSAIELAEIKSEKIREEVKNIIQLSHLNCFFGAAFTIFGENLDLNSFNTDERKVAIERMKHLVDMAYSLDATVFALASGLDVSSDKRDDAKKFLTDSLNEICDYAKSQSSAKQKTLSIMLETFDRDYTHKNLIGPTSEAMEIVTEVNKNYGDFGVMLDQGHLPLLGEDMKDAISEAGDLLKHVHIGSCVLKDIDDPRFGDTHPYFGYPAGENDVVEVADFLSTLEKNNYFSLDGNAKDEELPKMSVEIARRDNEDVGLIIANVKRVFTRAWAMAFSGD